MSGKEYDPSEAPEVLPVIHRAPGCDPYLVSDMLGVAREHVEQERAMLLAELANHRSGT